MAVSLDRAPAYTDHNIPIDEGSYYRGVNVESFDDLWTADENGEEVMVGNGKGGTDRLSFQADHPNDLYINGIVESNMIIEGDERMEPSDRTRDGYTYVDKLERSKVESGETPLRIWMRRPVGGMAIHLIHEWDKVFDSFPEKKSLR